MYVVPVTADVQFPTDEHIKHTHLNFHHRQSSQTYLLPHLPALKDPSSDERNGKDGYEDSIKLSVACTVVCLYLPKELTD